MRQKVCCAVFSWLKFVLTIREHNSFVVSFVFRGWSLCWPFEDETKVLMFLFFFRLKSALTIWGWDASSFVYIFFVFRGWILCWLYEDIRKVLKYFLLYFYVSYYLFYEAEVFADHTSMTQKFSCVFSFWFS